MAEKIDINKLRIASLNQRPSFPTRTLEAIEDRYEGETRASLEVYSHNHFFAKDEGFYPGLRQVTAMPGDTIWGVLTRQGFKSREIASQNLVEITGQINGLEKGEALRIGQPLLVPGREFLESMAS